MSLDWNLTAIKDREVHFPPETDEAVVRMIGSMNRKVMQAIWATIPTQIGKITEENAEEFYFRYRLSNRLSGFEDSDSDLTLEDVKHLVGLSTNVWPEMNREEWLARQWEIHTRGL